MILIMIVRVKYDDHRVMLLIMIVRVINKNDDNEIMESCYIKWSCHFPLMNMEVHDYELPSTRAIKEVDQELQDSTYVR